MRKRWASVALSYLTLTLALAHVEAGAASLRGVQGTVMVNSGQGFREVSEAFELRAGDAVMVDGGGKALIRYDGGCRVWVTAGRIVLVDEEAHCVCGDAYRATLAKTGQSAASLRNISGTVMVDSGQGFTGVSNHAWLKAGDRVSTSGNGRAVIRYQDGCTVEVGKSGEVVVRTESPCACGLVSEAQANTIPSQVGGVNVPGVLATGVAGFAGSVAIKKWVDKDDNTRPASN